MWLCDKHDEARGNSTGCCSHPRVIGWWHTELQELKSPMANLVPLHSCECKEQLLKISSFYLEQGPSNQLQCILHHLLSLDNLAGVSIISPWQQVTDASRDAISGPLIAGGRQLAWRQCCYDTAYTLPPPYMTDWRQRHGLSACFQALRGMVGTSNFQRFFLTCLTAIWWHKVKRWL